MNRYWAFGTFVFLVVALSICLSPANLHCASMSPCLGQVTGALVFPTVAVLGVGLLFFFEMKRNRFWNHFFPFQRKIPLFIGVRYLRQAKSLRLSIRIFLL